MSQNNQAAIDYPYFYIAPVNTGLATEFDLDNDGKKIGIMGDAHGFGFFEGHYGMAVLSRYPIDLDETYERCKLLNIKICLMRKCLLIQPQAKTGITSKIWQNIRLSSKSFWDLPISVNNKTVHILASHPTPPVFDGLEDRNGKRNHDEVRLVADYINNADYIYDDKGKKGGLNAQSRFVILGDLNAAPEGDKQRTITTESAT